MKTKLVIGTIATVIIALGAYGYYYVTHTNEYHPVHRETYLIDLTDNFLIQPERGDIEPRFGWDETKQERVTRIRSVINVTQGAVVELHLNGFSVPGQPDTWDAMSNELFRTQEIKKFELEVWNAIDSISGDTATYDMTSLLTPLVEELLTFQNNPKDDRVLVFYSDLNENNKGLSFLQKGILTRLQINDTSLWDGITGVDKLTDLSGVTIHFIHRPLTGEAGEHYRIVSNYLRKRLESYGATVFVEGKVIHENL